LKDHAHASEEPEQESLCGLAFRQGREGSPTQNDHYNPGDAETEGSLQPDDEPTRLSRDFFEVKQGERLAGRKAQPPEETGQRQTDRRLDVMRWPELLMHRAERQVWEQRRQCRVRTGAPGTPQPNLVGGAPERPGDIIEEIG
jgi:hypothetical protein